MSPPGKMSITSLALEDPLAQRIAAIAMARPPRTQQRNRRSKRTRFIGEAFGFGKP
jgi:hypothetical protein